MHAGALANALLNFEEFLGYYINNSGFCLPYTMLPALGPQEFSPQTGPRSVQPFMYRACSQVIDKQTDTRRYGIHGLQYASSIRPKIQIEIYGIMNFYNSVSE